MLNLLWTAALLLVVLWMLGFALHFMGGLIHLLLVLAAIAILVRVVLGRKPA
ncbi:MAG: lmo0937 family membrane protein [Polyangiaceae bacterium]